MNELILIVQDAAIWKATGLAGLLAYLLGSINFAVIVSRLLYQDDVRNYGSGNGGMTNMLRTYGKFPAFLTGLGDFFKGVTAVVFARIIFGWLGVVRVDGGYVGAICVLLGHLFPLYFHFKGGKGILTICGAILLLNPRAFAVLFVIFVPLAFLTRIVSLASVLGALGFPIITYILCRVDGRHPLYETAFAVVGMLIILYMHRGNIQRLLKGTEKKIESVPKSSKHPTDQIK